MASLTALSIDWGVASLPLPGEEHSGDLHVVRPFPGGALLAAMDGLGHGEEAARAASAARAILEAYPQEPVVGLVRRCHAALRGSRGVVLSTASVDLAAGRITWLGVGNVLGLLLRGGTMGGPRTEISLLLRGGVVGAQLPTLQPMAVALEAGDTLAFATDGIDGDFDRDLALSGSPQRAAEAILARHGRRTDDALVLVARFLGRRA